MLLKFKSTPRSKSEPVLDYYFSSDCLVFYLCSVTLAINHKYKQHPNCQKKVGCPRNYTEGTVPFIPTYWNLPYFIILWVPVPTVPVPYHTTIIV